jgi:dienelactone hydrolase
MHIGGAGQALCGVYVFEDGPVMKAYGRAHQALKAAEIHHDMITYGEVKARFFDQASRQYDAAVCRDAFRRTSGWLERNLRAPLTSVHA